MNVEYIETHEPEPICIDENYYAWPTPKSKAEVIVESKLTLDDLNRITKNTSPAKVYIVEIPSLAQIHANEKRKRLDMKTYGATGATPRASREDAEAPSISPHTQPEMTSVATASTVQVFVCDYNGIAWPVKVPVGTTLSEMVRAAFEDPVFKRGEFLGFEDGNLSMLRPVTAADATKWTAANPLRLKYKVRTSNQISIGAMQVQY
ncbi:unnamed protein product [Phytophthora lilii]|uniref:Unnamed protein product n=1 Tax=Phytophthora lilii TaxID=2077276 RepID=A0A9W6U0P0_9STRA|nr:unnamed protein product [Phytophthora lilii]